MVSEGEIIIAFLFKRSGKDELSFSEFYLPLSLELKWFSLKEAKTFARQAIQYKLLTKKGDIVKPTFEYAKVAVPVGFHPTSKPFEETKREPSEETFDVIKTIVHRIMEKTEMDAQGIIEKIKNIAKEKNITPEVAATLVGKEYNISLEDCFEEVENTLFRESTR